MKKSMQEKERNQYSSVLNFHIILNVKDPLIIPLIIYLFILP